MGNKEHFEILKAMLAQGVTVWNEWRKKNSDVEIDLSGETLNGADMGEPGLAEFNLHGFRGRQAPQKPAPQRVLPGNLPR